MAHPSVTFPPVPVPKPSATIGRAEIVVHDVDHSVPSHEARLFVNNPGATAATPLTAAHGYAGTFHVYGEGRWPAPGARGNASPSDRSIVATDAIRRAADKGQDVVVTVVPVLPGPTPAAHVGVPIFSASGVSIRTDDS